MYVYNTYMYILNYETSNICYIFIDLYMLSDLENGFNDFEVCYLVVLGGKKSI